MHRNGSKPLGAFIYISLIRFVRQTDFIITAFAEINGNFCRHIFSFLIKTFLVYTIASTTNASESADSTCWA